MADVKRTGGQYGVGTDSTYNRDRKGDANPDLITGAPGSHPAGTGVGAASAGAAGAAIGAVGGPVGAVIGAVVGAVAGGLAGKGAAEVLNPTVEDAYWKENYKTRPYVDTGASYDDYQPAYRHGWEARSTNPKGSFDEVETDLKSKWETGPSRPKLGWDKARLAARDAWDRVERAIPGDSDRDGK